MKMRGQTKTKTISGQHYAKSKLGENPWQNSERIWQRAQLVGPLPPSPFKQTLPRPPPYRGRSPPRPPPYCFIPHPRIWDDPPPSPGGRGGAGGAGGAEGEGEGGVSTPVIGGVRWGSGGGGGVGRKTYCFVFVRSLRRCVHMMTGGQACQKNFHICGSLKPGRIQTWEKLHTSSVRRRAVW